MEAQSFNEPVATKSQATLEQLLTELEDFLKILDKENLSSTAIVKKSFLADLLRLCTKSSGGDEEYIYMNRVTISKLHGESEKANKGYQDSLTNGEMEQYLYPPQKSLPDLPPSKIIPESKLHSGLKNESPEGYYEEAEPYCVSINDDEAVSSSYESYDEEESSKSKSAPHQWPSPEASIELMKDARICAFLWRKKWLGQWAKQLCMIKENRLLLDVNLVSCSVIHKEKNLRKQEHKLKIIPMNADVIVLGLQSKDQAEQWLRVIQETSGLYPEGPCEGNQYVPDFQRFNNPKVEPSESGSNTEGHAEMVETKDAKKKCTPGLKFSNLMNLGRKKSTSMDSPERSLDTCTYLNVLVNSQWKSYWCHVKDGQLHFYQDKNRNKAAQPALNLVGCEFIPDPSPDHVYSFRILHKGEELAMLETKSSEEMGHWLGVLLSESGSKTDPEELTYDYVDADRISCIVSAAKNSLFLMQRKHSEPNPYIDNLPKRMGNQEELYDDVDIPEAAMDAVPPNGSKCEGEQDRVYLDLTPMKSLLQGAGSKQGQSTHSVSPPLQRSMSKSSVDFEKDSSMVQKEPELNRSAMEIPEQTQQQQIIFPQSDPTVVMAAPNEKTEKPKVMNPAPVETKLGKNRTEAEVKRYSEERDHLEKDKEEIRSQLAKLRKEKRELKEMLMNCSDKNKLSTMEQKLKEIEEECKKKEDQRVDLELKLVEAKENLRKAESGPVTLGTTVDTAHMENASPKMKVANPTNNTENSPVNSAVALKNRPLSVMVTGKGTVLQKAK
ncbi:Actin filament-associated protein 1-like 2, partial [Ophiophagus hannah]